MSVMSTKEKVHEILRRGNGITDEDFIFLMKRKSELEIVSCLTSQDITELENVEKGIQVYRDKKTIQNKQRTKESKTNKSVQQNFNKEYSKVLSSIRKLRKIMKTLNPHSEFYRECDAKLRRAYAKQDKLERQKEKLKIYNQRRHEGSSDNESAQNPAKTNKVQSKKFVQQAINRKSDDYKATNATIKDLELKAKINWGDVAFYDKFISIKCLGKHYNVECAKSRYAYNSLINSFVRRLPPIEIEIRDSKVEILNNIAFQDIIELLHFRTTLFNVIDDKSLRLSIRHFRNVPHSVLQAFFPIDKTEYLNFLQSKQDDNIRYIPVYESANETPDGFLFTLKCLKNYLVVWESTSETDYRATYVFESTREELPYLHQLLFDYIMSDTPNKRQNLRRNKIKEFIGFRYTYFDHDDFIPWKRKFNNLLEEVRQNKGMATKSEERVSYSVGKSIREYIPMHNIMQNHIRQELEKTCLYSEILLESDNVDIKALTRNGNWHYFEVKTSCPKYCIREGLGQILEYVHYNAGVKAEKLFIVGPHKMSEHERAYIQLLRSVYNLPIWYRWYDGAHNTLKEPKDS